MGLYLVLGLDITESYFWNDNMKTMLTIKNMAMLGLLFVLMLGMTACTTTRVYNVDRVSVSSPVTNVGYYRPGYYSWGYYQPGVFYSPTNYSTRTVTSVTTLGY